MNLYIRTYVFEDAENRIWRSTPENEWPLLASITPNQIIMQPIHVSTHALRYLSPKHGRFYAAEIGQKRTFTVTEE